MSDPKSSKKRQSSHTSPDAGTQPALGMDALTELALNLHWSWNHKADEIWGALDSYLWKTTQNPWVILQTVSQDKINALLATPKFQQRLAGMLRHKHEAHAADAWFQKKHAGAALTAAAYFSMEFMLTEALPIYSGGLGNVAGDQMKAASDLGVPVVGIGLLWGQGYFRQDFDADGRQRDLYPVNDPGQLPIQPLRRADGEWLRLQLQLPGGSIWLRCWQVLVGRRKLYLLDANDFANTAAQRGITSELYGGDAEMRLKQEIVLGIGGWRSAARAGDRSRGLPSERRPRGLCRAGAGALFHGGPCSLVRCRARRDPGGKSVYHPHGRTCGIRPFRSGAGAQVSGALCEG